MKRVQVNCQAQRGLFNGEWLITINSERGSRQFFVDKTNVSSYGSPTETAVSSHVTALVLDENHNSLHLSIPGEPADLGVSSVWVGYGAIKE
jgi:hypothetical protein